jgi:uncharacterized protein YjbI with pentapeptide repeats
MRPIIPLTLAVGLVIASLTGTSIPATSAPIAPTAKCTPGPKANCANAKLQQAKLKGKNLKGAKFKGANLKGANLKGANLKNADLRNTNLTNANLNGANLSGALLHGASGKGATFKNARGKKLRAHKADLRDTKWKGAKLKQSSFTKTKLHRAAMQQTNVKQASFTKAYLPEANFGGAQLHQTDFSGTNFGDMPQAYALPDKGGAIVKAIADAKSTVDIVIYEIGGPNIVGQKGAPGALMEAVANGVHVRIMVNGQWWDSNCLATTPQSECATNDKLDWIYATQASLQAAIAESSNPGSFELTFANNNFQITHQKTIIVDASDPKTGQPLGVSGLPDTAQALVSTGNLLSYEWGYQDTTTPAEACGGADCPLEWAARDFIVAETDPEIVAEIASVFFSDLHCGAVPPATTASRSNTNGLLQTNLPLTWSNGATWQQDSSSGPVYPTAQSGYPYDLPATAQVQGNAVERTLDLIKSAKTSVWVYNEEMADQATIEALKEQAEQGRDVRVLMTFNAKNLEVYSDLANAGVKIRLTQVDDSQQYTKQLYMHAKVMLIDGTDAFMGSENISTASLTKNRELGVMVTTRSTKLGYFQQSVPAVHTFLNTFLTDWATPGYLEWDITQPSQQLLQQAADAGNESQELTAATDGGKFPMLCGPIPVRATP